LFTHIFSAGPRLFNLVAFNAAISACEKCGEWPQALALLRSMAPWQISADFCRFPGGNLGTLLFFGAQKEVFTGCQDLIPGSKNEFEHRI